MKKIYIIYFIIFSLFMVNVGCSTKSNKLENKNTKQENTQKDNIEPLTKEEALLILTKADELDFKFYQKSLTTQEVYNYYRPFFTKNYVDNIVFNKGNFKKVNDKWIIANRETELAEGSYFSIPPNEASIFESTNDNKVYILSNTLGEGLYAPHIEIITFIHTESG